ncbi:MAG: PhzF family phenazine biosynthesis protein [Amphritea sp.]
MKLRIHQIDAFTDRVFGGNYAAVIVIDEWLPDELMQSIATENNLSETAFAKKTDNCGCENSYAVRWFSPLTEIAFCGHATLATAYVLFNQDSTIKELNFFALAVGDLKVRLMDSGLIEMTFPLRKASAVDAIPQALLAGLSIEPEEVLLNEQAYLVVYPREEDVQSVQPNLEELKKLAPYDVVVTSASSEYDFISRYFWPANGTGEDPVTGSIHAGLAPLWAERLGKYSLSAYQASARGGRLHCRVSDNDVVISGTAVQYLEGYIEV